MDRSHVEVIKVVLLFHNLLTKC